LDEAIVRRWHLYDLDTKFKADWGEPSDTRYTALNDGEARPAPQGSYCVYTKLPANAINHHTGKTVETENQIQRITVSFIIHSKGDTAKSGKQKAKELAVYVAEAFDDKTPLDIGPDAHVNTIRGADWHTREGDEEWLWNLDYDFVLDAEYDAATT
jgi:hypothetical protein